MFPSLPVTKTLFGKRFFDSSAINGRQFGMSSFGEEEMIQGWEVQGNSRSRTGSQQNCAQRADPAWILASPACVALSYILGMCASVWTLPKSLQIWVPIALTLVLYEKGTFKETSKPFLFSSGGLFALLATGVGWWLSMYIAVVCI